MLFRDRDDAGVQLAEKLEFFRGRPNLVVLGIPRGGIIVAAQVARALAAPLHVLIAHKLGAPFNPEYAIGAITGTGQVVLDREAIAWLGLSPEEIANEVEMQRAEIERRLKLYFPRAALDLKGRTAILVDDGVATGLTTSAALRAAREMEPAELILAVPVGAPDAIARLEEACDQVVVLQTPEPFVAVGRFYRRFEQTTDEQVVKLLEEAREREEKEKARAPHLP